MFDLINTVELTAVAALVVATLAIAFGAGPRERWRIAAALAAWFVGVVWIGASDALNATTGIGVAGLAVAVVLPVVVLVGLVLGTQAGRARLDNVPLSALVGVQAVRVAGVSFVLLYAAGRLPAPFAPSAGWGDILVGVLALPLAWLVSRRPARARSPVTAWTVLGIADLVVAVGLGALSSPGPIRVFTTGPSSAIMTDLPWILVPAFLVPALLAVHLLSLRKLRTFAEDDLAASPHPPPRHAAA